VKLVFSMGSLRGEFAVPVGCCDSTVHEEVTSGDECTVRAHKKRTDTSDLVGSTYAPGSARGDHSSIPFTAWASQFILSEWGKDDARADRIETRTALAPANRFGHHPQHVR
jgi:hypothetical protein